KRYHLSDNEQCMNVSQWKLCIACSVGMEKFEVCELYSSVVGKNLILDDGTTVIEKNDDMHHALSFFYLFTKKKKNRGHLNNAPPLTSHGSLSCEGKETKDREAHSGDLRREQGQSSGSSSSINSSNSDPWQIREGTGSDVGHNKPEYYLLRAFVELGIEPLTVACMRYSHRFLDRKKQFAQVYKFMADQGHESIFGGKSCEMVYKQPKAFSHVWALWDEADSSASELEDARSTEESTSKTPHLLRRSSLPSPFFRPSFISLNFDDLALADIRAKQDEGVFNLVHNIHWKVENIDFLQVLDHDKMSVHLEEAETDDESNEETDRFGDDIVCRAQCVYFAR
ncbi:hypothetical protein RFI_27126, partial [Reticulomyxa filosa]